MWTLRQSTPLRKNRYLGTLLLGLALGLGSDFGSAQAQQATFPAQPIRDLTAGISAVLPAAPVVAVRGQPLTFSLTASETGQPATTSFNYSINWGDGTSTKPDTQSASGPTGTPAYHAYTTSGNYTITVTATDAAGLVSPKAATLGVTIQAGAVEADPGDLTQKANPVSLCDACQHMQTPATCPAQPICDPVGNIPNFFGDFFARGAQVVRRIPGTSIPGTTTSTQTLTFTGGADGTNFEGGPVGTPVSFANIGFGTITGPRGPYGPLTTAVTGTLTALPSTVTLNQNTELTGLIDAKFPGAVFGNGTGDANSGNFLYNYLLTTGHITPGSTTPGQVVVVNLPDPSGGGLVGRNNFFDNGSPVPQDRVYFFYNQVGDFRGLGTEFSVNRYVFGGEKTFFDGRVSVEVRVPFAGTANSDQTAGDNLSVGHTEFGNLGLALKAALVRTPNFLVSAGLGLSLPTANDSRLFLNGQPDIEIQNHATLLQPLLGIAWAPNDRFYSQLGLQFDFDPSGNPVLARDTNNSLNRAGVLHDQSYALLSGATGYWLYRNNTGWLTGVALQGELHYDSSFGPQHSVQAGNILVADLTSRINVLNATAGVIMNVGQSASLSVGGSVPLTGERLYEWSVIAQFNYRFGPRVR